MMTRSTIQILVPRVLSLQVGISHFLLLSLSMGGNNTIDEEMVQLQMGLGLVESSHEYHNCDTKLK